MQETRPDPTARERVRHGEHVIEHLLRRAGFGASDDEIEDYLELGFGGTVRRLLDYETVPDDVDALIGKPGYAAVTSRGEFLPRTVMSQRKVLSHNLSLASTRSRLIGRLSPHILNPYG